MVTAHKEIRQYVSMRILEYIGKYEYTCGCDEFPQNIRNWKEENEIELELPHDIHFMCVKMFIRFLSQRRTVFLLEIQNVKGNSDILIYKLSRLYVMYTKESPRTGRVTLTGTNPLVQDVYNQLIEFAEVYIILIKCKKPILENETIPYIALRERRNRMVGKQINFS